METIKALDDIFKLNENTVVISKNESVFIQNSIITFQGKNNILYLEKKCTYKKFSYYFWRG